MTADQAVEIVRRIRHSMATGEPALSPTRRRHAFQSRLANLANLAGDDATEPAPLSPHEAIAALIVLLGPLLDGEVGPR